jgi:hypothetical protein
MPASDHGLGASGQGMVRAGADQLPAQAEQLILLAEQHLDLAASLGHRTVYQLNAARLRQLSPDVAGLLQQA